MMTLLVRFAVATCLSVGTALAGELRVAVLDLEGLQCYACVLKVQRALQSVPGVKEAEVNLDKKTATVKFDSGKTDAQALIKATAQAGFPSKIR